jgi:hypothetical protein
MYSPIKSLPTSLLQREENRYPPFSLRPGGKRGGWGDLNFVDSMDRSEEGEIDERDTEWNFFNSRNVL